MTENPFADLSRLRRRLLDWFDRCQRDLPWRCNRDPYRIWVSEIMLQQTQTATVIPFFIRFLKAFPTLEGLAAANEQDVLRHWEGLGYYRRARHLHRAAQQIVEEHAGLFPRDANALSTLPGMGRYTVGAVLSQAFDQRLPILEANSQRVLCRIFGVRENPMHGPVRRRLWEIAAAILPRRRVGDFNQALMEVGALICTPAAPRCAACPLNTACIANRLKLQESIPSRAPRKASALVREIGIVVRRSPQVLLVQRSAEGRWPSLWEFPHDRLEEQETLEEAAHGLALRTLGIRVRLGEELLTLRHTVTHHRIVLTCFEAAYRSGAFRSTVYEEARWIEPEQLVNFPISAPQRRLARALLAPERQRVLF
jgi:A/G-specific adenine glycosylase